MRTHRRVAQILAAISLIGLALGFSVLGLLIVANEHDGGASMIGGIISILLGAAFLITALVHWQHWQFLWTLLTPGLADDACGERRKSRPSPEAQTPDSGELVG